MSSASDHRARPDPSAQRATRGESARVSGPCSPRADALDATSRRPAAPRDGADRLFRRRRRAGAWRVPPRTMAREHRRVRTGARYPTRSRRPHARYRRSDSTSVAEHPVQQRALRDGRGTGRPGRFTMSTARCSCPTYGLFDEERFVERWTRGAGVRYAVGPRRAAGVRGRVAQPHRHRRRPRWRAGHFPVVRRSGARRLAARRWRRPDRRASPDGTG